MDYKDNKLGYIMIYKLDAVTKKLPLQSSSSFTLSNLFFTFEAYFKS